MIFFQKLISNWLYGMPIDFLLNLSLVLQESVIVLAKLLLPQIFEKMTMQDLRALVAEKSTMAIYVSGETVEIPHQSIGFLLDGFIENQGDLITPPAVLMPSRNLSFQSLDTSGKMLSSAPSSFFPFLFSLGYTIFTISHFPL